MMLKTEKYLYYTEYKLFEEIIWSLLNLKSLSNRGLLKSMYSKNASAKKWLADEARPTSHTPERVTVLIGLMPTFWSSCKPQSTWIHGVNLHFFSKCSDISQEYRLKTNLV